MDERWSPIPLQYMLNSSSVHPTEISPLHGYLAVRPPPHHLPYEEEQPDIDSISGVLERDRRERAAAGDPRP